MAETPVTNRAQLNKFFIEGEGIHREILQCQICEFLGPEAHSRPSIHNVVVISAQMI